MTGRQAGRSRRPLLWLGLTLGVIAVVTILVPAERTLGSSLGLIIYHGAWAWTGQLTFAAAGLTGLAGLLLGRHNCPIVHTWSQALGHTGLLFWLTYLPMSLLVMQLSWGGLFLDEPRWRVPFSFGVVAVLLQVGLSLLGKPALTSMANLLFGLALNISLRLTQNVLHPDDPIAQSGSGTIRLAFISLLCLSLLVSFQIARLLTKKNTATND
jgi:hypothetical protein